MRDFAKASWKRPARDLSAQRDGKCSHPLPERIGDGNIHKKIRSLPDLGEGCPAGVGDEGIVNDVFEIIQIDEVKGDHPTQH